MPSLQRWPEAFGFSIGGDAPVVIVAVREASLAQKAGLQPGDQILEIDNENVETYSKQKVLTVANRTLKTPPTLTVISRIRTVDIKFNKGSSNHGMFFKGLLFIAET